jgi:DNA-binding transcriptional LysR family regulator
VPRLEEPLGVRLLNCTTRHVSLTEAGTAYYHHCARILSEAEAAEQAASALHREPRGTLSISAPDGFGWMHVAPAVPDLPKRYPGLSVGITSSHKDANLVEERGSIWRSVLAYSKIRPLLYASSRTSGAVRTWYYNPAAPGS